MPRSHCPPCRPPSPNSDRCRPVIQTARRRWSKPCLARWRFPRTALPPITARQLRLTLIRAGISLSTVEAAIEAIPDEAARDEARVEWEYASHYERLHPLMAQVASALELTDEAVDALWDQALTA